MINTNQCVINIINYTILLHSRVELAACCNDVFVEVFDISNDLLLMYQDDHHTDFVRGLTWFNRYLYSCSWDNTVLKHTIDFEINV